MANNSWITGGLTLTGAAERDLLENKIEKYRVEKREEFGYWIDDDWNNGESPSNSNPALTDFRVKISGHGSAYDLDSELEAFIKFCNKIGFTVDGKIYRNGEVTMDIERFKVENNIVSISIPKIVFDDGEVYEETQQF